MSKEEIPAATIQLSSKDHSRSISRCDEESLTGMKSMFEKNKII